MKRYDFIIVGAGASGLSLACHLAGSPLRDSSILIVDRSLRVRGDRTWAFWARTHVPFDNIACRAWHKLRIATPGAQRVCELGPYRYKVIRGADFYRFAHEILSRRPNVEFVEARVEGIEDGIAGARICSDQQEYEGRWVFDSRFRLPDFHPDPDRHCYLKMQFRGCELESTDPAFDPETPTFLDFRTPQRGQLRFMYVLPYSCRRALVEYVVCTDRLLRQAEQQQELTHYAGHILGVRQYRVVGEEQGISPMTDYRFPRRVGRRAMTIGVPGGMLKPTTGFAFTRIQCDSAAIVRSLLEYGHPFRVPATRRPYRLYESLMLRAMAGCGPQAAALLGTLFRYGSTERILRFLDERGAPV